MVYSCLQLIWIIVTISSHFHEVLDALLHLHHQIIKPPPIEMPKEIFESTKHWLYFTDCIGALNGSYVFAYVPADKQIPYRNWYCDITQNILAVVDFGMSFIYILPGWEGFAYNGKVLKDAISKGFKAPPGQYYFTDVGYTNSNITLSPYWSVRYYLKEIEKVKKAPNNKFKLFNYCHLSLRNVIERTFGVFKRH